MQKFIQLHPHMLLSTKVISQLELTYKYSIYKYNLIFLINKTIFVILVFKIPANCKDYNLPVPARFNKNLKKDASGDAVL